MIKTWITHGFDKIVGSAKAPETLSSSYDVFMAKNEAEVCQISFVSDEKKKVNIKLSSVLGITHQLYIEHFVPVRGELWPDPLVPTDGEVELSSETPTTVMIEFRSTAETKAGDYTVTAEAECDGEIIGKYTVNIRVWNFAMPVAPTCETAVGLITSQIARFHGLSDEEEKNEMYKKYYDTLLDHRISAYSLPYELLDPRADAYMSDPRVTSFACDLDLGGYGSARTEDELKKMGEKLASNPDWLHKAYVYPLDEPTTMEHLIKLKERSEKLHSLMPGVHQVVPFYVDLDVDENTDQIEYMSKLHDIWCPKAKLFEDIYSEEQKKKYAPVYDRMKEFKKKGDRVWWYVCNYPQPPYVNIFANDQGLGSRILFWLQYRYEVDGFLYWGANYWTRIDDPWNDVDTFRNDIHGDGILFYPGTKVGIDGPVVSHRMKLVRDGIDDIDLFNIAEKVLGREKIVEMILSAAPCQTVINESSDGFAKIRAEIGNALSEALS